MEIELALRERRVREARLLYESSRRRVAESELGVADLESRRAGLQASLRTHVLALQGLGRQRQLRLLLAMNPEGDLLASLRQLRFLARRDVAALEEYEEVERRLLQSRRALAVEQARLESWLEQEEARRAEVAETQARQSDLAREANRKRRQLEARAAVLREREERLARMIDLVDSRDTAAMQETSIGEFKGVLDWPLTGEVTTDFGPRLDPRYRTQVPHNGIEISIPSPRPVTAVYAGTVVFAAPFQGYGLTAVVRHAGGVMTLYAGLESLQVEEDDVVSLGDVLGAATDQLYFEFREGNRAVDPLDWLR